ncbi:hypothetical protein PPL_03337 [Heterostelium album PN500]|uniref:Uncharacterized protein n=1 Tax=Heterostelium pallidum (strain ATCC 26659 / Pp 5 / PN500) TaxID=670386 RepID=D3B4L2_HETP5|nr:hypothetical protein PPL_03337 [Heterostelium album PN500]EFA84260.1 hypothetical protein PPL_03337 [Heterostelium album PN500]|eukprot:XP_020436376.1 hypothetical protein PPL_03337 [Heterostelium album PN500]
MDQIPQTFIDTIKALTHNDINVIREAEAKFNTYKAQPDQLIGCLLFMMVNSTDPLLKEFSAILVRPLLSPGDKNSLWEKISVSTQESVKVQLIELLKADISKTSRSKVVNIIASLEIQNEKPQLIHQHLLPTPPTFINCKSVQIYVDSSKSYSSNCGNTPQTACPDILTGLTVFRNGSNTGASSLILSLAAATYTGSNNSFININIGETVSIVGSSTDPSSFATVDLQSNSNFISITDAVSTGDSTTTLKISNLDIINGKSSTQNGTVVNVNTKSTSTVNNNANYGSVFYTDTPGDAIINNCQFINNKVVFDSIVYSLYATTSFSNLTFTDNHATNSIITLDSNIGDSTISNTPSVTLIDSLKLFNNTLSSNSKGFLSSINNYISIDESVFQFNTGSTAIYFVSTKGSNFLLISDSNFISNSGAKDGGAIYQSGGTSDISNTTFNENKSQNNGGALFLTNYVASTLKTVSLTNNTVIGSGSGSSIFTNSASNTLSLTSVSFTSQSNSTSSIYCNSTSIYLYSIKYDNVAPVIACSTNKSCLVHSDGIIGQHCDNVVNSSDEPNTSSSSDNRHSSSSDNHHPDNDKNGLSGGAIAGIVIGVIVAIGLIGAAVFFVLKRRNRSQYSNTSTSVTSNDNVTTTNSTFQHYRITQQQQRQSTGKPIYILPPHQYQQQFDNQIHVQQHILICCKKHRLCGVCKDANLIADAIGNQLEIRSLECYIFVF